MSTILALQRARGDRGNKNEPGRDPVFLESLEEMRGVSTEHLNAEKQESRAQRENQRGVNATAGLEAKAAVSGVPRSCVGAEDWRPYIHTASALCLSIAPWRPNYLFQKNSSLEDKLVKQ